MLVGKIDYDPDIVKLSIASLEFKDAFPVYGALSEMNLDIVVPIVKLIRQTNFTDQSVSVDLAVDCLIKLYEKDGTGKEMAKKRLELELDNATESEKTNIKKALELIDSK